MGNIVGIQAKGENREETESIEERVNILTNKFCIEGSGSATATNHVSAPNTLIIPNKGSYITKISRYKESDIGNIISIGPGYIFMEINENRYYINRKPIKQS